MPEEKKKINCWIPLNLYNKIELAGYESVTQAVIEGLKRILEDPGKIQKGCNENISGYVQDTEGYNEDTKGYNEDAKGSSQDTEGYLEDMGALTAENTQLKEDLSGYEKDILGYMQEIEGSKKDIERIQEGYKQDITGYKENIKALNVEITRLRELIANSPDPVELIEIRAHFEGLQRLVEEKEKQNDTLNRELEKAERDKEDLKATYVNYFKQVQSLINQKAIEAPGSKKPWYKFW